MNSNIIVNPSFNVSFMYELMYSMLRGTSVNLINLSSTAEFPIGLIFVFKRMDHSGCLVVSTLNWIHPIVAPNNSALGTSLTLSTIGSPSDWQLPQPSQLLLRFNAKLKISLILRVSH